MLRLFSRFRKKSLLPEGDLAPAIARSSIVSYGWPYGAEDSFGRLAPQTVDEMLTDPLIRSAIYTKKLGVLAVPWKLRSSDSSDASLKRLEFIQYVFDEFAGSVTGILFDAMDALAKGYSVLEMVFVLDTRKYPGMLRLSAVKPKDPSLFGFEVDEFLNIKSLTLHVPGSSRVVLPREKFVIFVYQQRYGQPYGESDLRASFRHWSIKRELIRQWSIHLEKFASPTVLGKYKRGLSEDAQRSLLDALEKLQRQSAIVHPDDIEVSLLQSQSFGPSGYAEAIDYHNREIARSILGQTLTTDDSRKVGSLALGKVHLQVLMMHLAGLRRDLSERVMNEQIIRPLVDINFGAGYYPVFEFEEPSLDVFRTGRVL